MNSGFMLELPFPDWDLSPNSRKRHKNLKKVRKFLKYDCCMRAMAKKEQFDELYKSIKPCFWTPFKKKVPISLLFYPPNRGRRDRDNCLAAMKYGLDGVAEAWKIDDELFGPILVDMMPAAIPFGKVELYVDNIDIVLKMILKGQESDGQEIKL